MDNLGLWVFIRLFLEVLDCLATPSLPDAVRVNRRYNLLKLHS